MVWSEDKWKERKKKKIQIDKNKAKPSQNEGYSKTSFNGRRTLFAGYSDGKQ